MNSIENKVLNWVERHLHILFVVLVTVLSIVVRFSLADILSGDANKFLLPWYDIIGSDGLYNQVGDYNLVYQFMIWVMTKLPLEPLYSYKILSCIFDFMVAVVAAVMVNRLAPSKKSWNGIIAYCLVIFSPLVFINSSAWAQCDAIYSAFAILGVLLLDKEKYNLSLIALGVSFAFKLHAVFILPVYLYYYYTKRRFSILRFSIVPATMLILATPLLFWGRNILDTFTIYMNQTTTYTAMAKNYPSIWALLCNSTSEKDYFRYKTAAIIFTVFVLAMFMICWIRKGYKPDGMNLVIMSFILSYSCVMFLPSMHDRYGFIYEIFAIMIAIIIPKTIPLCVGLVCVSLRTYGGFLSRISYDEVMLVWVNVILYVAYIYILTKELKNSEQTE